MAIDDRGNQIQSASDSQKCPLSDQDVYFYFIQGRNNRSNARMLNQMLKSNLSFSWFALFLGPFYYLYRRLYQVGAAFALVIFAGSAVVELILPFLNQPWLVDVIWNVFLGLLELAAAFAFYPLYKRKAMNIYDGLRDNGETCNEIRVSLKEKGGTNLVLAICVVLLWLVLMQGITMLGASAFAQQADVRSKQKAWLETHYGVTSQMAVPETDSKDEFNSDSAHKLVVVRLEDESEMLQDSVTGELYSPEQVLPEGVDVPLEDLTIYLETTTNQFLISS